MQNSEINIFLNLEYKKQTEKMKEAALGDFLSDRQHVFVWILKKHRDKVASVATQVDATWLK